LAIEKRRETMKKASALTGLALLGFLHTHAQDTKKFRLGLEVCPNMGWISTDEKGIESDGSRLGFRFGLLGDVQLGSNANYFFSTGLFLNNVGSKTKFSLGDSANTTVKGENKFQYVELPISVKLKTNEIGYMTYFGQIGFDVGVLTAAKGKAGDGDFEDASDLVSPIRVALAVGGGLEYNFSGNTSALLGIKYSNGFTNVNKDKVDDVEQPKAKLHYFEVTVGALF
jgi:opacity protein-like surface antigen